MLSDRCSPAVGGIMVEVYVGTLHAADLEQFLQRSVRTHRYRRHHHPVRIVIGVSLACALSYFITTNQYEMV
ncbi:hypothetical protein XENOCAPTIV_007963 [Xenoophorus captivus]|uniref:Uncharacterized protein n=1 Tax=Xenoophorus captivus TaxID=1517983 RepID=A0ABV0SGB7_9TELE